MLGFYNIWLDADFHLVPDGVGDDAVVIGLVGKIFGELDVILGRFWGKGDGRLDRHCRIGELGSVFFYMTQSLCFNTRVWELSHIGHDAKRDAETARHRGCEQYLWIHTLALPTKLFGDIKINAQPALVGEKLALTASATLPIDGYWIIMLLCHSFAILRRKMQQSTGVSGPDSDRLGA